MICDVCHAPQPGHILAAGAIAIRVNGDTQYLDDTDWALCASCVDGIQRNYFSAIEGMARAYAAADGTLEEKLVVGQAAVVLAKALAIELERGAVLRPLG